MHAMGRDHHPLEQALAQLLFFAAIGGYMWALWSSADNEVLL